MIVDDKILGIPNDFMNDKYIVTVGKSHKVRKYTTIQCKPGLMITFSGNNIAEVLN